MLTNDPFYWGSVRKVVVAFGSLFSNLHIVRIDPNNTPAGDKSIKVPLTYGPKEKWVYRIKQQPQPGIDDSVEMLLPRMSYELVSWQYDASRQLTHVGRTVKRVIDDNTVLKAQYNPVPYNLIFELNVMSKTIEDGLMMMEQIVPFFVPDYTVTVIDIPEMDLRKDIPIILNSIQSEDTWTGDFKERRTIVWTLAFTAKAYLYPPVKVTKVNLKTIINVMAEGETPDNTEGFSIQLTPDPEDANASTITGAIQAQIRHIKVLALPSTGTLVSGQTRTFIVNVIASDDPTFTLTGVSPTDSTTITATGFTYTAGLRTASESVTVTITSVADTSKFTTVTLTLNP